VGRAAFLRGVYSVALVLATPLVCLYLLYRSIRQPEYRRHWAERFGFYGKPGASGKVIWIHAVSVGETYAAWPLIDAISHALPSYAVLVTHMTPTGRKASEALFGDRVQRAYIAYDYPWAVRHFLAHFRPAVGILLETELWPNLLAAAHTAGVPMMLVNARLSERSFRRAKRFASLVRPALAGLHAVLAQSEPDALRLEALGAASVSVMGNLKFDVTPPVAQLAQGDDFRRRFGDRPILLLASTREGEETLLLDALRQVVLPHATLIVMVPRHPQRFDEVAALVASRGLSLARRSDNQPVAPHVRIWLGDSMGEMFAYYRAASVAYVGGGLLPFGTHNLIEPCAVGCPVLLGPYTYNFEEAAANAIDAGAAVRVGNALELMQRAGELLSDPGLRAQMAQNATRFALAHRGATDRALARVEAALEF